METNEKIIKEVLHQIIDISVGDHFLGNAQNTAKTREKISSLINDLDDENIITITSLLGRIERLANGILGQKAEDSGSDLNN